MHKPEFDGLPDELRAKGVSRRHARRIAAELRDHYDDLVDAALARGESDAAARQEAMRALGPLDQLVEEIASRRELKSWPYRYPQLALVVYPLACLAVLPASPVFIGVANRTTVLRWGASLLAAGLVTATLMLVMQLTIIFS